MSGRSDVRLLVTCEHAGNRVPEAYRSLFRGAERVLATHRGWDPGSLPLARHLARRLDAPLRYVTTTRLLVDPNRSPGNETLFSEFTRELPEAELRRIMTHYHRPHWRRVRRIVDGWLEEGATALHLGVHTFTPVLDDVPREVDVGVLFDPAIQGEARFAAAFLTALKTRLPDLRIGPNAPYHGAADGLTTGLRRILDHPRYLGIELEVGQKLMTGADPERTRIMDGVGEALERALERMRRLPAD